MSNTTPFIQNLFTSRDNNANSATYVGQIGRLWYDSVAGLRVSDGNTPGGAPAVVAVSSANIGNLTIANTTISTIQANANINLTTNGGGEINVTGSFAVFAPDTGLRVLEIANDGQTLFVSPAIDSLNSALEISGELNGAYLPPTNIGGMLQITGQQGLPARVYLDAQNNYPVWIGRRHNGNITNPTAVLANQVFNRMGGNPYLSSGAFTSLGTTRIDYVALEDQTSTNQGSAIQLWTTPIGANTPVTGMTIASTGITNAANVIPISDQSYNLGTPTNRWNNVYAGQGGLWLADSVTDVETQLGVSSGTFYINGVQNIALGNLVIANTTFETSNPAYNINMGNVADTGYFEISRTTQIVTQNLGNSAALLINGSLSNVVPTEYTNTLLHTINVPGYDSVSLYDNFSGNTNTFSGLQGRAARGTIQAPTNPQANDVLFRLSGVGYGNGFDTALGTQGGSRIDFRATENFTANAKGSDIHFWTTQPGTTSTVNSGSIDYQGFSGNSFTFTTDNSVQTTAGIPLTQKANALGVATLGNNGYLTAAQIPPSLTGALVYKGSWDAANNTPTLANGSGTAGWEYSIGVTGTQDLGAGSQTYVQGGFVIYNGTVWSYVPPSGLFTSLTANTHLSVNQPTGAITISVDATPSLVNSTIVSRDANGSFAANVITATLSGAATSAATAGTVTSNIQSAITQVGTLTALTVSGNTNSGNLRTAGLISATGNITGNYIVGNGSALTSLTGANVSGTVANATYATSAGSATTATTAATVTTNAQPNITSVGTLTSLSSSGNITASYFLGNGSQSTGIVSSYGNANVNTLLAAWGSNTVSTTGTITAGNITGGNLLTAGIQSSTGNVIGGNILSAGLISSTGNATHGNILTGGQISATGNATSNIVISNTQIFSSSGVKTYVGNTAVTLNFNTDSIVFVQNPTNTLSFTLGTLVAGSIVRVIVSWATKRQINFGVNAAVNSTTGATSLGGPATNNNQSVRLDYICIDGTSANTYVSVSYV
jgi:hypothetical protein